MRYHDFAKSVLLIASSALIFGGCTKKQDDGGTTTTKAPELGAVTPLGSISVKAPLSWKSSPPKNNMRRAQWAIGEGDKAAELVVYYFGAGGAGTVEKNLDRWYGQFKQADGKPSKDAAKVEKKTFASMPTTIVELGGTFIAQVQPGAEERHNKSDHHMLAAIVEAGDGPYFLKMVGPSATVKSARAGFDAMLGSLATTGGEAGGAAAHPAVPAVEEDEEAKKKAEAIKRNKERRAKDEAKAAEELKRWTDDLRKKVTDLVATDFKNGKKALQAVLASPHRVPGNSDRDKYRHPLDTLVFFGLEPGMTVVEAGAGAGWYTELLAPVVAKKGKLIVATYDPTGPMDSFRTLLGLRVKDMLAKSPELFGKVETTFINPPDSIVLAPDGTVDLVLAFREMHNWQRGDSIDPWIAAIHKALKPGGVFGVVQHRADDGQKGEDTAGKGRLPKDWLVEKMKAAGFDLAGSSEANANPKDTKNYEEGVWTLPPAMALGDKDKDKYLAIGESDRMTLKFVKRK